MSDDFIPLNQSTPVQGKWQQANLYPRNYQQNQQNRLQNSSGSWTPKRGGFNNRGKMPRNNSYGGGNSSYGGDNKPSIDAFLHPSMLQDPWAKLQQNRTA